MSSIYPKNLFYKFIAMMANGVFLTFISGLLIFYSKGSLILTVPTAGNCGDDTHLTCQDSRNTTYKYTSWYGLNRILIQKGRHTKNSKKYTEIINASSFTLTIHNTGLSDAGEYRCTHVYDHSQFKHLSVECKASGAVSSVTEEKKVSILVDKLYPSSPTLSVSFRRENIDVTVAGSKICSNSEKYSGYYKCVWSTNSSLPDGSYTFNIVVTTITQADPLTGSFQILSPLTPVVSNTVKLDGNRTVVFGYKNQSLTIQCTSSGGYPSPTLAWYKDSVSVSNQLASKRTKIILSKGTYTVILSHTFTPIVTDDKRRLVCRSYYPRADSAYTASKTADVIFLFVSTVESFVINGKYSQNNVTVFEHEADLQFICTVFPVSTVKIRFKGDALVESKSSKTLSFIRRDVACLDSGVYTCEACNEYGHISSKNITLIVICSPRPFRRTTSSFSSLLHVPLTLSFDVIANPEPGRKGFSWFKESNVGWIPLLGNDDLKVTSVGLQSNLTLLNVSKEDFGRYKVIAKNNVGSYEQEMFVYEKETYKKHTSSEPCRREMDSSAMIVVVTLGIVCLFQAICLIYLIIVYKRKCRQERKPVNTSPKTRTYENSDFANTVTEPQEQRNDESRNREGHVDQEYTELSRYGNVDTNTYDELAKA